MINWKTKIRQAAVLILLIVMLTVLGLSGCAGNPSAVNNNAVDYSMWIVSGEDSSFYPSYDKNPVIEYMLSKRYGPNDTKINLDFVVPVAGQQLDSYNTLLSTGDYPDMMDFSMYNGSLTDLYEQGIVLDLTEYIEQHMPNFKALLDQNPDLAQACTYVVNGEKKILSIRGFHDQPDYTWGGYQYRRDWIIKYGKNPVDGSTFAGSYTRTLDDGIVDRSSWEDNVIFPSGGADPVYISDWEWMFEIFARAIQDLGITDGYVTSLYYPGFIATGDMYSGFGGGSPVWYTHKDGTIHFGGTEDDFQVYLQAMNTWYNNGWIDKAFTEHSADMFFMIDDAKVRSGKIGFWYGVQSELLGYLDDGEDLKDGMVVYAARQPINDIYGTAAQQNQEPYTIYQMAQIFGPWVITDKAVADGKDIVPLLKLIDYAYSTEGALLCGLGLNKAQYEETKPELYTRLGLTEGAYYQIPEDQAVDGRIYSVVDYLAKNDSMVGAVKANKYFGLTLKSKIKFAGSENFKRQLDQWVWYENKGGIGIAVENQLTSEEQKIVTKTGTTINEFMAKNVPSFIKGEKDPFSDADWQAYVKALNKYAPDKVTKIYQEKLNNLG